MRMHFFIAACLALSISACMNNGKTPPSSTTPPLSETTGVDKPASEQQGKAFSISTAAYYQGGQAGSSSPGQVVSLTLRPDGYAKMVVDYQDNSQVTSDTGVWKTAANGNLMLHLRRIGAPDTSSMEFRPDGDRLEYTGTMYGPTGLVLQVRPTPPTESR